MTSISMLIIYNVVNTFDDIPDFYAKNIRGSFFTGFLTVGSFLLSLKTFIVVKLKENVFDTDIYKERLRKHRAHNPKITLYGPIKRLSGLIFFSICSSIATSVSQLTIGLVQHWAATLFCIAMASFSITMLIATLLTIKGTLDTWLDESEELHNKKEEDRQDNSAK